MPQAIDRSSRLKPSPPRPKGAHASLSPDLEQPDPAPTPKLEAALGSSATGAHTGAHTTLDEFIGRLLELRARGAGALPVVIESRSRSGAIIYGEANARRDRLVRVGTGWRNVDAAFGELAGVVRAG